MQRRDLNLLLLIFVLTAVSLWIDLNPLLNLNIFGAQKEIRVHEGLDLQGGMQVLLQAKPGPSGPPSADQMTATRDIIEQRVNGLGVTEPVVQVSGADRIVVELPGIREPEKAIEAFGQVGFLEVISTGSEALPVGTIVTTTLGGPGTGAPQASPTVSATGTVSPTATPSPTATSTPTPTPQQTPGAAGAQQATPSPTPQAKVYQTILTGADIANAEVTFDNLGRPQVSFELKAEGARKFADFTSQNVGTYLSILMDKRVINSAVIRQPITQGRGVIEGLESVDEARNVVLQLKYGALPVALEVKQVSTVGPTLGQDSLRRSVTAGIIGVLAVMAFMLVYYRLPGFVANLALLIYASIVFAIFKVIPVTLTLAGVAGFILSVGMAVDANVLIFARMKEELRAGKPLRVAVSEGFNRAWPSIRDSNITTLITCAILFEFGSFLGTSIVKGFAVTLAIGVLVSMFSAIVTTRTFLRVIELTPLAEHPWLFAAGAQAGAGSAPVRRPE